MKSSFRQIGFDDHDLQVRVESYLDSRHYPGFRDLSIQVLDGTVTVSGRVDSFHQRQVAINTCRRVAGVMQLVDQIEVLGGANAKRAKPTAVA